MKEKFQNPQTVIRWLFAGFTRDLPARGRARVGPRRRCWMGSCRICTQSGQTVKSYFDPSYGGFSGTFLNVALVCAVCLGLYCLPGSKPDGVSVLAFFLTAGFCFWGTTILNIWFSFAGVLIYCLVMKKKPGTMANAFLFSTGLAPLITEMLFNYPTAGCRVCLRLHAPRHSCWRWPSASSSASSSLPFCRTARSMHKGYDLYNAAVPIGLIAFFLRSLLYKVFLPAPPASEGVGSWRQLPGC